MNNIPHNMTGQIQNLSDSHKNNLSNAPLNQNELTLGNMHQSYNAQMSVQGGGGHHIPSGLSVKTCQQYTQNQSNPLNQTYSFGAQFHEAGK